MATSNVYLIMSEPMLDQVCDDRRQLFQDVGGDSQFSPDTESDGTTGASDLYGTGAFNRPGAVEVLDFTFEIEQKGSEQGGRPRSVEKIERSDVVLHRAVDIRSPILFRYCVEGTYIGAAEIQVFGPDPTVPYLTYRMNYVHVSKYKVSGGGDVPVEEIGLRFGELGVKFDNAGIGSARHGNTRAGAMASNWSWVTEIPVTFGDPVTLIKSAAGGFKGQEHGTIG